MSQHTSCQSFGTDCKDVISMIKDPSAWPTFSTELAEFEAMKGRYHDFKFFHVPRAHNKTADALAKTAKTFHRDLLVIDCSVPVWILRPPLV